MGDRRRADGGLAVAADVEECRALRRADPLVEVRRVVRGAERVEVERDHARRVGAVDERVDAAPASSATIRSIGRTSAVGLVTWLTTARRVRSVVASRSAPDDVVLGDRRERQPRDDDARAVARGHVAGDVQDRVVLVVGRQDLVARLEPQRAQNGVDAAGRVRDQGEVVRVGAEERPERPPDLGEEAVELAREELDRLGLRAGRATRAGRRGPRPGTRRTTRG